MTSDLFEKPIILEMLGGKEACVTLAIPTNEACSHIRPLYVMTKFNSQPASRILVNNRAALNILPASMPKKLGKKKSDILATNLIMTTFYGNTTQPLRVIFIELTVDQ